MLLYLTFTMAKVKIKLLSYFFPNSHGCNKSRSLAHLHSQPQKLKQVPDHLEEYHNIIQEKSSGILECFPDRSDGERVFCMPHRAVIRAAAETTNILTVFDTSAKESTNHH